MSTKSSSAAVSPALRLKKQCLLCGESAQKLKEQGIPVVGVSPFLYFNDLKRQVRKMCRSVFLCANCFAKALVGLESPEGQKFLAALSEALRTRYNGIFREGSER